MRIKYFGPITKNCCGEPLDMSCFDLEDHLLTAHVPVFSMNENGQIKDSPRLEMMKFRLGCSPKTYNTEQKMSKGRDRTVSQRPNGTWANKKNDAKKATSIHQTQHEAIEAAKENLVNQGGGELTIHGVDGKIRDKNTIPPGNDPYPPKG